MYIATRTCHGLALMAASSQEFPENKRRAARDAFLAAIAPSSNFYHLFDHLPGIAFFAKDRAFRLMAASRSFLGRLGMTEESEIIGRDDFSLFPRRLAEVFRRDDEEVIATGRPKLGMVELFLNPRGFPDWFLTNKLPVRDREGRVIGIMGTVEEYSGREARTNPLGRIAPAVEYIRGHLREPLSVPHLARLAALSERQLNRKFQEAFGHSPRAFILRTRLVAACDELAATDRPIQQVALDLGFYDQSSFTQHFRRLTGVTPLQYRKRAQRT
jgi:AraC-like DNA-binding protein